MRSFLFTLTLYLVHVSCLKAQTDSLAAKPDDRITLSGFVDAYFSFDIANRQDRERPSFIYSHNRLNEFTINNALISLKYAGKRTRANIGIHTGSYVLSNYASEPPLFQLVYEANAGAELAKNLWLDAGILSSHIGFESAVSKDNWTLTRSLNAENSPYYESGAKITYLPNGKWLLAGLVLNGWQNIRDLNSNKAIGTQVQFIPSDRILFNYSTFIGNEKPDSAKQFRYYQDFYASFKLSRKLNLATIFDIGWEEKPGRSGFNRWHTGVVLLRYQFTRQFATGMRAELFRDKNGVLINSTSTNGFNAKAASLTIDYAPVNKVLFRIEGKVLNTDEAAHEQTGIQTNQSVILTSSLAISF